MHVISIYCSQWHFEVDILIPTVSRRKHMTSINGIARRFQIRSVCSLDLASFHVLSFLPWCRL